MLEEIKKLEHMEEPQLVGTKGLNYHHTSSPPGITSHHHYLNHDHHLSIFPPTNHEGLPTPPPPPLPPPPPHAPLSFSNSNSESDSLSPSPSSSSSPPKPCVSHLSKWFDFALHLWNSKLLSFIALLRSRGFSESVFPVATTASFLGFLWFWIRRWRRLRGRGGKESVDHLKLLIKEKDEKIIQLLEQIALMNKVLLARYRIPVSRTS